jgi:PAS domain S-box-containing protein
VAGTFALGIAALAALTLVSLWIGFDSGATGFLYLIVITLLSLVSGFLPAFLLSILAVATLHLLFVPSSELRGVLDVVELAAFLVVAAVITQLVSRATRAARQAEVRAHLLDLTHDAVVSFDMDRRITYWNRGAERLYGWTATEAMGRPDSDLLQAGLPGRSGDLIASVLAQPGRWQGEDFHMTRDGRHVVVALRCTLERDESGRPAAVLVTANDITERKRAEDALRKSEERWRAVFEHNPIMCFMLDRAGTVVSANPFGARQLGYPVEELVGRSVPDVFLEADREAALDHVADCLAHPGEAMSWELRKIRKDGTVLWVRETGRAVKTAGDDVVILVVSEDITQRKHTEDELRASEARFRVLVDHASDAFFLQDEHGIVDVNRQACESLGFTRDELIGMTVGKLDTDAECLDRIRRRFAMGENPITFESRHRRKDGSEFPVEVRARIFRTEDGRQFSIALARDITDRKEAERALQEAQAVLTHATRVTTLGEVTASFAHELNQPLAAIVNNANACCAFLVDGCKDDEVREALADIVADAERASAIVERVRALAKRSATEHAELRVDDLVNDVVRLAAAEAAARRVAIRTDVPADLPVVLGDRVQLQQVLLNLVVNAMDAMAGVGEEERRLDIRGHPDAEDDRAGVTIRVEDRGMGLQSGAADRLFEPFYTTKTQGMGLGLAISRSIVQAHGGRLWAEPNQRKGAVFAFRLPAVQAGPGT